MGRRANLQKSDGGRVPRPWRGTRSELGRTRPARGGGDAPSRQGRGRRPVPPGAGETVRRYRRVPSRQGRGTPPSRVRLYERTYPPYIYKGGSDDPLYI
jgi:hypothetical protein